MIICHLLHFLSRPQRLRTRWGRKDVQVAMASVERVETAYSNEEADYISHGQPRWTSRADGLGSAHRRSFRGPLLDAVRGVAAAACGGARRDNTTIRHRAEPSQNIPRVRVSQQEFLRDERKFHKGTASGGTGWIGPSHELYLLHMKITGAISLR